MQFVLHPFEVLDLISSQGNKPRWNQNKKVNRLTAIYLNTRLENSRFEKGKVLEFTVKAQSDIENLNSVIKWDEERNIGFIAELGSEFSPAMKLSIEEFSSPVLTVAIPGFKGEKALILSDKNQVATTQIIDLTGRLISQKTITLEKGLNNIQLPANLNQGMYIMQTQAGSQTVLTKYQILN